MYKSIMVPVADAVQEHTALDAGVRVARASGARLHVVHVQESRTGAKHYAEAKALLAAANWASDELDESVSFHVLERGPQDAHTSGIADTLHRYAAANSIDLIVMGRRRHSLNRLLFGSIGERLLLTQDAPILFVPPREKVLPRRGCRILLALDGTEPGEVLLDDAAQLARALDGTLTLTRVLAPIRNASSEAPAAVNAIVNEEGVYGESSARAYLDETAERIEAMGVKVRRYTVPGERVSPTVRKTASLERVHIIALAPRAAPDALHFAPDSVTESLLRRAETALLARRRPSV